MKDYTLVAHKLEDKIVLDSIEGINVLKANRGVIGHICGGMAVSTYLCPEDYRQTIDTDYTLLWGGDTNSYRDMVQPLIEWLTQKGYEVGYQKKNITHNISFSKDDDSFLIQHQRRSLPNFEKNRKSLEREMENHRLLSKRGLSYEVISPEDLAVHKLARILKFHNYFRIGLPRNGGIPQFRDQSDRLRLEVTSNPQELDPLKVAKLRLLYDIYDVKQLAEKVGLNFTYFSEAIKDFATPEVREADFLRLLEDYEIKTI